MRSFSFIFSLSLLLLTASANAQLKIGLTAVNGASVINNDLEPMLAGDSYSTKFRYNFAVGVRTGYCITDWFNVELDVLYDQINTFDGFYTIADETGTWNPLPAGETGPLDWWQEEYWSRWQFFAAPLTFNFKIKRFSLLVGGQYSFLFRAGGKGHYLSYEFNYDYLTQYESWSTFSTVHRHNFSLLGGVRFHLYKGLSIEGRYIHGLRNLRLDWWGNKAWTRQLQFGFSYMFLPKKKEKGCHCF
jgi:hypothetical protein